MRYDATADVMAGITEVLCYGTRRGRCARRHREPGKQTEITDANEETSQPEHPRNILKIVGISSQREIEQTRWRRRSPSGRIAGTE